MASARSNVLDPVHLSDLLRTAGELDNDQIAQVVVESERHTLVSTIKRLRVDLDGGSRALRLFLKTARSDSGIDVPSSSEAGFYIRVAPLSPPELLPRCFDAVDGGAAGWHVLLEDLTDSHEVVSEWPIPPTMEQCERIIGAHARFHAAWWDEPRLGHGIGIFIDEGDFDRIMEEFSGHFAAFVDRLGDRLPAERRRVVERLSSAPGSGSASSSASWRRWTISAASSSSTDFE